MDARAFAWAATLLALGCRDREGGTPEPSPAPATEQAPRVVVRPPEQAGTRAIIHHGSEIEGLALAELESLDLAMSSVDQVGHLAELDPNTTCDALDLVKLAERAPRLQRLRISGCQGSLHAGLAAFGGRLESLTLADVTLDGVTIGNLSALVGLESLSLTRVAMGPDRLEPLRAISPRRLVLTNLEKDSPIAGLFEIWGSSLREVVIEGDWAGHEAMLALSNATATEALELRGTRVGNFSLNQIKPLEHLRDVTFEGSTFNDNSALYFRDLPVTRFVCNCSRIGDGALRSLRHTATIERLELRDTSITPVGLQTLTELEKLQELVLLGRDIGATGYAALAELPRLRRLELDGDVENPRLPGLGQLEGLRVLRLRHPQLDDRVTEEIAKLRYLEVLDLSGTQISDTGLERLGKLTHLRELYVGGTRVTNRGLGHLAGLSTLEVLTLDHTDVVDEGVASLKGHTALRELRLDSTLVTDASIDVFLSLPSLERLSVAHTVVTHAGIARLADHPRLDAIDIEGIR